MLQLFLEKVAALSRCHAVVFAEGLGKVILVGEATAFGNLSDGKLAVLSQKFPSLFHADCIEIFHDGFPVGLAKGGGQGGTAAVKFITERVQADVAGVILQQKQTDAGRQIFVGGLQIIAEADVRGTDFHDGDTGLNLLFGAAGNFGDALF